MIFGIRVTSRRKQNNINRNKGKSPLRNSKNLGKKHKCYKWPMIRSLRRRYDINNFYLYFLCLNC